MSGFSEQRRQLHGALVAAGLSDDAAAKIASILGNSAQEMRHAGQVSLDTTPAGLRSVTPQARKLRFPNLDQRQKDPDHRRLTTAPSEERSEPEPDPNVVVVVPPQQTTANFQVAAGAFTDVQGNGQAAQVDVRNFVAGRPLTGLPLTLLDAPGNRIVGKAPRAQVANNDGTARLDIRETPQEVLWNLQMLDRSEYDVVTKVEYVDGKGLEVTYERIKAWNQQKERVDTIPVQQQPVVTEIVDDRKGLRAKRRTIPVFSSFGAPNSYFNTFRIGTFTGGWVSGSYKTVTQVWPRKDHPSSPAQITVPVFNMTRTIADTPETKYVLYAPRTQDVVRAPPGGNDDPAPDMTGVPLVDAIGEYIDVESDGTHAPESDYYAIEIQEATACTAFSSLNGILVSELWGFTNGAYDAPALEGVPQALSYSMLGEYTDHPAQCLMWRSAVVDVITDVQLTSTHLVFSRKRLVVLHDGDGEPFLGVPDPIAVEVGTCEPPEA